MNPIVKRKGGKFYAKHALKPYFPRRINTYVEPFTGGGSIFLSLEKFGIKVKTGCYLNDVSKNYVTMWKVFWDKTMLPQLTTMLDHFAIYSKDVFDFLIDYEPKNEIERVFRLISLTSMSFQGDSKHYYVGIGDVNRKMNKLYKPAEFWIAYQDYMHRMNTKIGNEDYSVYFQGAFNRKETFIYADPPYYNTSGYVEEDEPIVFGEEQQEQLCKYIHNFKGKVMLSLNKHDWVKDHYDDLYLYPLITRWAGNTESDTSKQIEEYLILNYDYTDGQDKIRKNKDLLLF